MVVKKLHNYINIFWLVVVILIASVSSTNIFAQSSDIHSAQIIKQQLRIVEIADSLSSFQYSQSYSFCYDQISRINYADKPDLYSDLLFKMGFATFHLGNVKNADSIMNSLIDIDVKNVHPILQARILNNKLRAASFLDRNIEALKFGKNALVVFDNNENVQGRILTNINIGHVYNSMGKDLASKEYFKAAIDIAKNTRSHELHFRALRTSIKLLLNNNDIEEVKENLTILNRIARNLKKNELKGKAAFSTAIVYYHQNNYYKSDEYLNQALEYFINENLMLSAAKVYTWKAAVAMRLDIYRNAAELNILASEIRKDAQSDYLQASSMYNIANSLLQLKEYDSALYYITQGEELYKPYKSRPDYVRGMDLHIKIHQEKNEFENAFYVLGRKMDIQDSLFKISNKRKFKEIESDFAIDKYEKLKQEMILESKINKLENKRNSIILYIAYVILFFVIISSILLFLHIRGKNMRNVILTNQKLIFIQMNSHFVFNALTAIQSLIYRKHLESAIHYLTIFSSLINKITGETQKKYTSLQNDVGFIMEFLQIQKLRFGDVLKYQVEIDSDIDMQSIKVPPMLTYPFIEYAVEECVQKAEGNGQILINVKDSKKHIEYEIIDVNLGFIDMKACFIKRFGGQEILCSQLTIERISIYRKFFMPKITFAEKNIIVDGKTHKALSFKIKK